jgi:hypothetical protein
MFFRLCVRAPRTDSSAAERMAAVWAGDGTGGAADGISKSEGGRIWFKALHQRGFWRQIGNPT